MKIKLLFIAFFCFCFLQVAMGGGGTYPAGANVKMLKQNLLFKGGNVKIMTNDSDDPTSVAKSGDEGTLYIQNGTGILFQKQDTGLSTNWIPLLIGPAGSVTDECVARWDGTGGSLLQDSVFCITDGGLGSGLTRLGIGITTPAVSIHVQGNTFVSAAIEIDRHSENVSSPILRFRKARGTIAVPVAINSGDFLGIFDFWGYQGAAFNDGTALQVIATENWSAGNVGSKMVFVTTNNGGSAATSLILDQDQSATFAGNVIGSLLTANKALTTGASKELVSSATTDTELGYVNGVTSAIQDQLDALGIVNDSTLNSCIYSTISLSDDGGLAFSWGAGSIYDSITNAVVSINSGSDTCANNSENYLIWVSGATLTLQISPADVTADEIPIAHIHCQDSDIVDTHLEALCDLNDYHLRLGLSNIFPVVVTSGIITEEDVDVTNAWDVLSSSGVFYHSAHEVHTPSQIVSRTTPMVRHFLTAGAWDSDTNAEINTTQWNDGINLAGVTAARYYKSMFIIDGTRIHWVYPDEEFTTLNNAILGDLPTTPPGLAKFPKSVAVIIRGNDAAFPAFPGDRWIDIRPVVAASVAAGAISDHGNAGGLADDDHGQYVLLLGRAGGQTIIGGTAANDDLTFQTTSDGTKGTYFFPELTVSQWLKTDGSSGLTTVSGIDLTADVGATILPSANGGTGQDSSAFTGLAKIAAGVWSSSALVNADVSASANITATKLGTGAVDNTEFNLLDGRTYIPDVAGTADQLSYFTATNATAALGAMTDGQMVIGSTGATPVIGTITGTANQVNVATGAGTLTLSTPQNIATSSNVQFSQLNLLAQGDLRLEDSSGGEYFGLQANATTTTYTLTMPAATGAANQLLQTDGSGALSWASTTSDNSPGLLSNVGLQITMVGSAVIVSLKQSDGSTDATGGSPIKIGFRNTTLTTGGFTVRSISTALSMTIDSGATLGTTNADDHRVYIYALDNAGIIELAVSLAKFSETVLQTTTLLDGAADDPYTIYSDTTRATKPIKLIGSFISTQTTAGTWDTGASEVFVGESALAEEEFISACYSTNGGQTITTNVGTDLNFENKEYDTHTIKTGSSPLVITFPIAGKWNVLFNSKFQAANWNTNEPSYIRMRRNGTLAEYLRYWYYVGVTGARHIGYNGTKTIDVNAGDTLSLVIYHNSGSDKSLEADNDFNYICVTRWGK